MKKNLLKIIVLAVTLSFFSISPLSAQEKSTTESSFEDNVSSLLFIKKNIVWLQNEIERVQSELEDEVSEDIRAELQGELADIRKKYKDSKLSFSEIATGIRLEPTSEGDSKKRDFVKQAQELAAPLLDTFRRISERPRKIEQLKTDIFDTEEKIALTQRALSGVDKLIKFKDNLDVLDDLQKVKKDTQGMLQGLQINLDSFQRQLQQETGTDKSLVETTVGATKDFLRNRGKNLILSLVSFLCIWWVLSALRGRIFKSDIFSAPRDWIKKPLKALYNLIAISMAIIGAMLCLYLLNDWVLLTFIVLFLSAVAWTSRQWLPKFMQEGRIILNMGTVKEGERIIWKGVPFLVRNLGFYSTLVNKQLQGGHIKVAAAEFIGMHSRPVVKDEPWFPTTQGDWVLLSDETYGKIFIQTPEQVVIQTAGGTHKYYAISGFIAQNPQNLSRGFCISTKLGLDYEIQARICRDIPEIFMTGVKSRLNKRFSGDDPDFKDFNVEFHSAGESSLNLWAKVECPGRLAHLYFALYREMQTTLMDICNEHKFAIPFKQLTIHIPRKNKDGS